MTSDPPPGDETIEVLRGEPTRDELAAVSRVVVARDIGSGAARDPLSRWRAGRRAALRARPEWSSGG